MFSPKKVVPMQSFIQQQKTEHHYNDVQFLCCIKYLLCNKKICFCLTKSLVLLVNINFEVI